MLKGFFTKKIGISPRIVLANVLLVTNILIWYFCAFITLKDIINRIGLNDFDAFAVWSVNFGAAAFSALIGAVLVNKIGRRISLFAFWIILGVFSSIMLLLINTSVTSNILIVSFLLGISFGLGMPVCMGYFSDSTNVGNRSRIGGIIYLSNYIGVFVLLPAIMVSSTFIRALVLAAWRGFGLTIFALIKSPEKSRKSRSLSYISILSQRSFLLYFIPWIMFSLANSLSFPLQSRILGEDLVDVLVLVENALVGTFAIIGGFLSDFLGRKRMAITGFVALGLGYAILGIYPENLISWYLYVVVDGAAWGIFSIIFILTVWGDLAHGAPSEKHYALGGLPYLLSNFLQITLGSYITQIIPAYASFSFTAFFLFLAVIPLMYAPETLPEKTIMERELRQYIEKAKKVKEKYV